MGPRIILCDARTAVCLAWPGLACLLT